MTKSGCYHETEPFFLLADGCIRLSFSRSVLKGVKGSAAEAFAKQFGIPFETLGNTPVSGDYNSDGEVTVADAVLLARFVFEDDMMTAEETEKLLKGEPDRNQDGLITVLDVSAVLQSLKTP